MIQIRPWLFVGRYQDTRYLSWLTAKNIGAMLQLAEQVDQPGISVLYLPVDDGRPILEEHLRKGLIFVQIQKQLGKNVLIACGAGQSRSVAFATAALKQEEGIGLLDALKVIRECHPEALPHPELWESLCLYFGEPVSVREMMHIAWGV
jgi:hypothetical protein